MKLEVDLWGCLLNVYNNFEMAISKRVEKVRKTLKNPKGVKIITQIPKVRLLHKTELMSGSIQQATYVLDLKDLS